MTAPSGFRAASLLGEDRSPEEWVTGLLEVADLRERRVGDVPPGRWVVRRFGSPSGRTHYVQDVEEIGDIVMDTLRPEEAIHVAAEAQPVHVLAEVALLRGIAERHKPLMWRPPSRCSTCVNQMWPCPDLLAAVATARAYLGDR